VITTAIGTAVGSAMVSGVSQSGNPLAALLASRQFVMADLFIIVHADTGLALTFTTSDVPIYWRETWFDSYGIEVQGLNMKRSVGVGVDEQDITIIAPRGLTVNGQPWMAEIAAGFLDSANITRERVFMADWKSPPMGGVIGFDGRVSTVDSVTTTTAKLKVKSTLNILNLPMPRNSWQVYCLHTLFDTGCGLSKVAYQVTGTVGAGSDVNTVQWPNGATAGYYWQGTIQFITGANSTLRRTIKLSTGSQLILTQPLPFVPQAGDTFYVWPGCDKTLSTCVNRFNNKINNRSYPYIPVPQVAL
jgi:uncharacterized phage protein (TIGR02218 family)